MTADRAVPTQEQSSGQDEPGFGRNAAVVAAWTLVSRVTGLLRVVVTGAVLGPTFFGNVFASTNVLPNLVFELLIGSLFASVLVPPLVRALDLGDEDRAQRLAGGFLGMVLVIFSGVAVLVVVFGPVILRVLGAGVSDPAVAQDQRRVGLVLLLLVIPQLLCYGVAGTCAAVMNARGRFALAAAAPALENIGLIVTLALSALLFGVGVEVGQVGLAHLLLLGGGATLSVALHASAQWYGAHRLGITLRPRAGWRDPEVRQLLVSSRSAFGQSGLNVVRVLLVLVVANSVPGGVVAFDLALAFVNVISGLVARPVATAVLPALSRLHAAGLPLQFRAAFDRGTAAALALVLPAALLLLALAAPVSRAVTFGELGTVRGTTLVAVSLAAVSLGAIGDGCYILATAASYARDDPGAPLRGMILRVSVSAAGMGLALSRPDEVQVLALLGLALTAGDLAAGGYLYRRVLSALPPGSGRVRATVARSLLVGLAAAAVGAGVANAACTAQAVDPLVVLLAGSAALLMFVAAHALLRSPELAAVRDLRRADL